MVAVVRRIDLGFDAYVKRTNALAGSAVKVGVQSSAGQHEGAALVDIAIYNEFGTRNDNGGGGIPERPFMRGSAAAYQADIGIVMAHLAKKVRDGASVRDALSTLGEQYQAMVRAYVTSGGGKGGQAPFAPNSPATIKRKGSSKPLIDTGALLNAIRWEITR